MTNIRVAFASHSQGCIRITIDHRSTSSGKTTQNRLPIGFLSDYLFSGIVVITLHKLQFVSSPGPGRVRGGTPCRFDTGRQAAGSQPCKGGIAASSGSDYCLDWKGSVLIRCL